MMVASPCVWHVPLVHSMLTPVDSLRVIVSVALQDGFSWKLVLARAVSVVVVLIRLQEPLCVPCAVQEAINRTMHPSCA